MHLLVALLKEAHFPHKELSRSHFLMKWELLLFFLNVRAYLGINSMKLITNGIDHIVTADKYTPRKPYSLKTSNRKVNPKDRSQGRSQLDQKLSPKDWIPKHISVKYVLKPNRQDWIPTPSGPLPNHNPLDRPLNHLREYKVGNPTPETAR